MRLRYRKHRDLMNPFSARFKFIELLHEMDFVLFNVVAAVAFPFYLMWLFVTYGDIAPGHPLRRAGRHACAGHVHVSSGRLADAAGEFLRARALHRRLQPLLWADHAIHPACRLSPRMDFPIVLSRFRMCR